MNVQDGSIRCSAFQYLRWVASYIAYVGAMPACLAHPAWAQPFAYVVNANAGERGTVSVVDTATQTVVQTIPVGTQPGSVALAPDGGRAYVTNTYSSPGSVSVIDTTTSTIVDEIAISGAPVDIAITPDGAHAYVVNVFTDVSVIDLATDTVVTTVATGNGSGITITPDGTRAYVSRSSSNEVAVIDIGDNRVVARISVRDNPVGTAVTPDGTRVYVASSFTNDVTVIDVATNTVVTRIPVGNGPHGVAFAPDGTAAYVANFSSNTVSIIDPASNTVIGSMSMPVTHPSPIEIALTPDPATSHLLAYVTSFNGGAVVVFDTVDQSVVSIIAVQRLPQGIAIQKGV